MTLLWPDTWENPNLRAACAALSEQRSLAFLLLSNDLTFDGWVATGAIASDLPASVVLLLAAGPLQPACLLTWREGLAAQSPPVGFSFVRLPSSAPHAGWVPWLERAVGRFGWQAAEEDVGLDVGSRVQLPASAGTSGADRGYDPFVLAIPPDGPLAPVLRRLDAVRRAFEGIRPQELDDARRRVHAALDDLLAAPTPERQTALREAIARAGFMEADRTQLPRVLLLGESGTGKTVLARYLAAHQIQGLPFRRVPIPEYLGREDYFELDVFGYCKGAYTGAREEGSRGELGELIGGVVFFDEIGDANPTIQAKLLAYLDDYVVKPRGVSGAGYYCPLLVVAATNRDVYGIDGEPLLRTDLLNRFNEIVQVPSLLDRSAEVDLQVDLMLQLQAQSSRTLTPIARVGTRALARIRHMNFTDRNFRLLDRVLATASRTARAQRRDYLVAEDIPWEPPTKSEGTGTAVEHELKFDLPIDMDATDVERWVERLAAAMGRKLSQPTESTRSMVFFDTPGRDLLATGRLLRCVAGFDPESGDGRAHLRYDYKVRIQRSGVHSSKEMSVWAVDELPLAALARRFGLPDALAPVVEVTTAHSEWEMVGQDAVRFEVSDDRFALADGTPAIHELELAVPNPQHLDALTQAADVVRSVFGDMFPSVWRTKYEVLMDLGESTH